MIIYTVSLKLFPLTMTMTMTMIISMYSITATVTISNFEVHHLKKGLQTFERELGLSYLLSNFSHFSLSCSSMSMDEQAIS